jgi:hypothetical protein
LVNRIGRAVLVLLSLMSAASCASESRGGSRPAPENPGARFSQSTYSCSDGGLVKIDNLGTSIRIVGPDGEGADLPASPPGQNRRYGPASNTITIEGDEAAFTRNGRPVVTCTR